MSRRVAVPILEIQESVGVLRNDARVRSHISNIDFRNVSVNGKSSSHSIDSAGYLCWKEKEICGALPQQVATTCGNSPRETATTPVSYPCMLEMKIVSAVASRQSTGMFPINPGDHVSC